MSFGRVVSARRNISTMAFWKLVSVIIQSSSNNHTTLKHIRRITLRRQMSLEDKSTGSVIAREVKIADNFWRRFRGLMFKRKFRDGEALLFKFKRPGRHSVHTFFVRFPIDLAYLDSGFKVIEIRTCLKPWRVHTSRVDSSYLIELPAGTVVRSGIEIGHKILLEKF